MFKIEVETNDDGLWVDVHGADGALLTFDSEAAARAKLAELYPADRATGFQAGDIRGAFTLSKPLR